MIDGVAGKEIDLAQCDKLLYGASGLEYAQVESAMMTRGTAPGCHSPLLLVLRELLLARSAPRVLEFGSGCTTAYLSRFAEALGGTLLSLENDSRWYGPILQSIESCGVVPRGLRFVENIRDVAAVADLGPYDLILSDCVPIAHRFEALTAYRGSFKPDATILVDDCDQDKIAQGFVDWAAQHGYERPRLFMSWSRGVGVLGPLFDAVSIKPADAYPRTVF